MRGGLTNSLREFDRLSVACFKVRVGGEANLFTFFKETGN